MFFRFLFFHLSGILIDRFIKFGDFLLDCHQDIFKRGFCPEIIFDTVENLLTGECKLAKIEFNLIKFLLNLCHFIEIHLIFLTHSFNFLEHRIMTFHKVLNYWSKFFISFNQSIDISLWKYLSLSFLFYGILYFWLFYCCLLLKFFLSIFIKLINNFYFSIRLPFQSLLLIIIFYWWEGIIFSISLNIF